MKFLDLLNDDCALRREAIAAAHRTGLARVATHPRVRNSRTLGTVAAFDLVGENGYLSDAARGLAPFALERGVLVRPLGNVVYLLPPYCTTEQDIANAFDIIADWLEGAC